MQSQPRLLLALDHPYSAFSYVMKTLLPALAKRIDVTVKYAGETWTASDKTADLFIFGYFDQAIIASLAVPADRILVFFDDGGELRRFAQSGAILKGHGLRRSHLHVGTVSVGTQSSWNMLKGVTDYARRFDAGIDPAIFNVRERGAAGIRIGLITNLDPGFSARPGIRDSVDRLVNKLTISGSSLDRAKIYRSVDILLLSGDSFASEICRNEAMACGTFVVAFGAAALAPEIENCITGLKVHGSEFDLADIASWCERNRELIWRCGLVGSRTISMKANWGRVHDTIGASLWEALVRAKHSTLKQNSSAAAVSPSAECQDRRSGCSASVTRNIAIEFQD